jgi:CCR4-NOT transcription complex subunit 7/8
MIKDVWITNFFSSMDSISKLVDEYNYISMDTEYPGTVYVPINTENEFEYNMIRANCDNLKLIQVGIALSNHKGESPTT